MADAGQVGSSGVVTPASGNPNKGSIARKVAGRQMGRGNRRGRRR